MAEDTFSLLAVLAQRQDPGLELDAIYHRKTIVWRKEEDDSISIKWGGIYHILNPTAAFLWMSLNGQATLSTVIEQFVAHYQALEPDQDYLRKCAEDTVLGMITKGLLAKPDSVWDEVSS